MEDNLLHNLEEQRRWNQEDLWVDLGNEWNHELGMEYMWENNLSRFIEPYAKGNSMEIACGFGRITAEVLERCKEIDNLYVSDLNENCVAGCVRRFGKRISGYYVNDGFTLPMVQDLSMDFVYSYDAFVHMHKDVVFSYIKEIHRILKPGSYCFLHTSDLVGGSEVSFENVGGRANFDFPKFKDLVDSLNMTLLACENIQVNEYTQVADLFVLLYKKPENFSNVDETKKVFDI